MERRESKSRSDRREIRSVCGPVPTIVLNPSASSGIEHALSHSRSAGDLDTAVCDIDDFRAPGRTQFSNSVTDGIQQLESKQTNGIGLYCSPRMTRRIARSPEEVPSKQAFYDTINACSLNHLDPGSRVGSSVSLNSEYTSRSVGLISNDSNSECSSHHYAVGIMDASFQKHGVLKRYYSTPEKDEELLNYPSAVRRNSKSMGNMQEDMENSVSFDFGSDSTNDDNLQNVTEISCDIDDSLTTRTTLEEVPSEKNLVTMVTGSSSLRDGRIQKWLTEICDPDENSNSK